MINVLYVALLQGRGNDASALFFVVLPTLGPLHVS
jgi:hypothetical protein